MTSEKGTNWCPPHNQIIVTFDLIYSLAQVTEHCQVKLKDQNVSEETKQRFEELNKKCPKVFSLNNEDIGCTQLVAMDIMLSLKQYNWVQQEIETLE